MTRDKTLDHYLHLIKQTDSTGKPLIIVGGQAVNFWANKYTKEKELQNFKPYTSDDIDFYGLKEEADNVAKALGVEIELSKKGSPSPVSAFFEVVGPNGVKMSVHFLHNLYGIKDELIASSALEGYWKGIPVRVTNPIVGLQGKIACLDGLDQSDRQDEKHVRILIICVRAFLKEIAEKVESHDEQARELLDAIEVIVKILNSRQSRLVSQKFSINFSNIIPVENLRKMSDPKIVKFLDKRYPDIAPKLPTPES